MVLLHIILLIIILSYIGWLYIKKTHCKILTKTVFLFSDENIYIIYMKKNLNYYMKAWI